MELDYKDGAWQGHCDACAIKGPIFDVDGQWLCEEHYKQELDRLMLHKTTSPVDADDVRKYGYNGLYEYN